MTQQQDIRKAYFGEGKNVSQIAQEFKRDRKTVRKYVLQEDWNQPAPTPGGKELCPKLNPFKETIDRWLIKDKQARRKQRHTAKRVFDRLREEYLDFHCSYRTVATYVASKKKELYQQTACRLPLEHIPGEAQLDFGKTEFIENGQRYLGAHLNVSFPYSNAGFTQLFKGENLECMLEGLKAVFEHIGGVPLVIRFDNPSTVVTQILSDGERKLTEAFMRFQQHYGFEAVFCNPNAGHEKGSVEAKVGYHRRNLMVPVPEFRDIREYNKELLAKCDKDQQREHYKKEDTIANLFKEDLAALMPLPVAPYEVCKYITVKTNGYAKFSLEGRFTYSSAPRHAKQILLVKVTAHEVIPLDDSHREIVRHRRLYGDRKQESMQWLPYLTQLSRSPGALKYSGIYKMLPDPLKDYLERIKKTERGKVLKVIAQLTTETDFKRAVDAVEQALQHGAEDIDSIMALHNRMVSNILDAKPISLPTNVPVLKPFKPNIQDYNAAFIGGGKK